MRIVYLLESTALSGGVRVVFDQTRALIARGHHVSILALRGEHLWYPHPIKVIYQNNFSSLAQKVDVCIATYWTTVAAAMAFNSRLSVHFCQGCEWRLPELAAMKTAILQAYAQPLPKLTLGRWLNQTIQADIQPLDFPMACIGQVIDQDLYRLRWRDKLRWPKPKTPTVLIVGLFESSVKGIRTALTAVNIARQQGEQLTVVRVSPWPLSESEQGITTIDEYHCAISPQQMRDLYLRADVFLASSQAAEGFGLPFAEALSMGVPCVATCIPSYRAFSQTLDFAQFVEVDDALAMASALAQLLHQPQQRRRLRYAGIEVAQQFTADKVAAHIEQALNQWLSSVCA
jgi:glycosyltransferase involved in cell wall biosynthesis